MQGTGIIKAVLSGDTVVIQGAAKPGAQAPELQLSLSHLSAPRIARHSDARDEPFGWPAREFLRRYAIGKQARFKVDYKLEKSGRLFASLWLLEAPGESINAFVARHGWARIEPAKAAGRSEEYETLVAYGKAAEEAGVGVHCAVEGVAEATVRSISWALPPSDAPAVAEALKASPQPAIVEGVAGSAGQLRVLLTATSPSLAVTFTLAGVQAPRVPAGSAAPTPTVTVPSAAPAAAAPASAGTAVGSKVRLAAPAAGSALLGAEEAAPSVKPSWASKGPSAAAGAAAAPAARPAAGGAGSAPVASPPAAAAAAAGAPSEAAVALEARAWIEARLLHRDVLLHVGGADKHGNLVGRLEAAPGALYPLPGFPTAAASAAASPSGGADPALDLLRIGAAKVADWSLPHLPGGAAAAATLRAAERAAKAERLRLWAGYTAPAAPVVRGERRFDGRVSEVLSGDTVIVAVPRAPGVPGPAEERRVSLASVRAPRMGARGGADAQPWAAEAREFLRRTLVGREVSVTIDYARVVGGAPAGGAGADGAAAAAADERPGVERQFGTLLYSTRKGEAQHNVAVELVGEGLAEVIRHRGDEDRASAHEELLAAEEAARTAKRGLHSGKAPAPAKKPVDVSQDSARTKAALPSLQRARTMRGVVDFVFAGGRVKVTVPSENITFVFGLAGVRCPSTAKAASKGADGKTRPARAAEAGGPEALAWTREHCLQQDVELEVEDVDKTGSVLLGSMWVGRGGARRSAAEELLRAGLATTIAPVITRVKGSAELLAAEAKAARIGVWEGYVEPKADEDDEDADDFAAAAGAGEEGAAGAEGAEGGAAAAASADFPSLGGAGAAAGGAGARRAGGAAAAAGPKPPAGLAFVTVCDIADGSTFFVQEERDKGRLAEVNARMAALLEAVGTQAAPVEAARGKLVACLFAESTGADGKPVQKWFRARIEGKAKDAEGAPRKAADGLDLWAVQYVDFGNRAEVTVQAMRPLPDASLVALPAIAKECGLALLRVPAVTSEEGEAAAVLLGDMAFGRRSLMRVHSRDPVSNKALVSLYEPVTGEDGSISAGACVNEALVSEGLARISGREAKRVGRRAGAAAGPGASADGELLARLRVATEAAKKARAGIFAYGDAGDSEDEEKPRGPAGKPGRR